MAGTLVLLVFLHLHAIREFSVPNYIIAFLFSVEFSLYIKETTPMLAELVDLITFNIKMTMSSLIYSRDKRHIKIAKSINASRAN